MAEKRIEISFCPSLDQSKHAVQLIEVSEFQTYKLVVEMQYSSTLFFAFLSL